jgi:PAS domain S-box-containing protein
VTDTIRTPAAADGDPLPQSTGAAADATTRRLAFRAAAGELFSSSLDYEQTLQHVARLAVPALGDLCIVDVVDDGHLRRVATAHTIAAKTALLDELRRRYPPSADSPQPAGRVLRTGEPELLSEVTPGVVASHTRDPEHAALILAIGIRSHVAVPLVARGGIVGVISVGITESARRYTSEDLVFVQDVARLAALAVDNARLYHRAQEELAERQRAEAALRLSENRFRAVMEQFPLSIQIFDARGAHIRTNAAWEALWGVTLSDIRDYNILEDPQLEALGIAALLRRAFSGGTVEIPAARYDPEQTLPDRSRHADPARWVRAFAYPVKDETGAVREVVLVQEDVTGARRAEDRLRASEERLRLALNAARMNVWDWDLKTGRIECSDNAQDFWGIAAGQAADFIAVIHPEDRAAVEAAAQRSIAGEPYLSEYRLIARDGQIRWLQSRGRVERAADGRAVRILGVTVDITELKIAEQATRLLADAGETLNASLDYRATLQNLAQVIVPRLADWCAVDLLSETGELERVSVTHPDPARIPLAHELFRRYPPRPSDPAGTGRVLGTWQPDWAPDITDEMLAASAYDAEHLDMLRLLRLRSYVCVPLLARGIPIGVLTLVHAESGRRFRESDVELATDVGRRAAAAVDNARLFEQLRLEHRRKDEFLATLAHELRNPLAPIRTGFALLGSATDAETTARIRQVVERQLTHMVRLIDDLLDLSRVTRGTVQLERARVDLAAIVGIALEASRPLLDQAGLLLEVRLPQEPVPLDADSTRLAQVLSNLLNNAAKYTSRGGRVELTTHVEDRDVEIQVADSGRGIPREMLVQIFEMFAQVGGPFAANQGGLGIGLTLVRRLVELHGGHVWAESDGPGTGSRFFVRLPLADGNAPRPDPEPEEMRTGGSRPARRVLVVDDNVDAAEMLAELLKLDGHEVRTATSGPDALEAVAGFVPHVALLDIGLPGMNGFELARRLRAQPGLTGLTLVAVTGWGQREDREQSKEAGFDHHLTKPVDPDDVRRLVASVP